VALAVAVSAAPVSTEAGASSDNLLELAGQRGPAFALGFGVSPLHWELVTPSEAIPGSTAAENRTLGDLEPHGKAVSLDVKLRWPTTELPIEPYVSFGPALFVDRPQDFSTMIGLPGDPMLRVGAKAGAGFNWRLGKDATLFGSYDLSTTRAEGLGAPAGKTPATGFSTGYDVLYGVRFRY
jgi:hypothetical protein